MDPTVAGLTWFDIPWPSITSSLLRAPIPIQAIFDYSEGRIHVGLPPPGGEDVQKPLYIYELDKASNHRRCYYGFDFSRRHFLNVKACAVFKPSFTPILV